MGRAEPYLRMKIATFAERHDDVCAEERQPTEDEDKYNDGDRLSCALLLGDADLLLCSQDRCR